MANKQELSALESRDIMRETKGYQEGVEHENRRVVNHLLHLSECGYTTISIDELIAWLEGGEK